MDKLIILFLGIILIACGDNQKRISGTQYPEDFVYQRSTIDALLAGRYDDTTSIGHIKNFGGFGLGTLNGLDGELIALEGEYYQVKTDGKAYPLDPSIRTPFITCTFFDPNYTVEMDELTNFNRFKDYLDSLIKYKNKIISVKVSGVFDSIQLRSVARQTPPYKPLAEVIDQQVIFYHKQVAGTLVGFIFPEYLSGVNVPGYHFHFLSEDKTFGGHVLELSINSGKMWIDDSGDLLLSIPEDHNFQNQNLSIDRSQDLKKVEVHPDT